MQKERKFNDVNLNDVKFFIVDQLFIFISLSVLLCSSFLA